MLVKTNIPRHTKREREEKRSKLAYPLNPLASDPLATRMASLARPQFGGSPGVLDFAAFHAFHFGGSTHPQPALATASSAISSNSVAPDPTDYDDDDDDDGGDEQFELTPEAIEFLARSEERRVARANCFPYPPVVAHFTVRCSRSA